MCDINKYEQIYKDIMNLKSEDTTQLVDEAKDEGEREFYMMVGNFLLQNRQRQVIERNLF